MPDDLELVAERADVGGVGDLELEEIVRDTLLAHPLLAHGGGDSEPQEQMLHSLRHRARRGEKADATGAPRRRPCAARSREQTPEEQRELIVRQPEDRIGYASVVGDSEQSVSRRDDFDAIAAPRLRHDAVRHVATRQRHRPHALAVGVDDEVRDHGRRGVGEDRATSHTVPVSNEVSEQHDLGRREPVGTEERERVRHRDPDADTEVAERQPTSLGEEWMRDRRAHLAARPGTHPEDRLDPVVDERLGLDDAQRTIAGQRRDRDRVTADSQSVELSGGAHRARHGIEDRRVPGDALPHARACPDDDERRRLQTRQQLVEIVVAGGEARDRLAAVVELLEAAEADLEQIVDRRHRVGHSPLRDVVHHRLGSIDCLRHIVGQAVPELCDLSRDADQTAEQRVLFDDVRVPARRSRSPESSPAGRRAR